MWEILKVLDVRGLPLMILTLSKLPQEDHMRGALGDGEMIQLAHNSVDVDPRAPVPNSFLGRNPSLAEDDAPPADTKNIREPPLISDSGIQALQRLVGRAVPRDDLPSVIETIVSNMKTTSIVECLERSEAQIFIDTIDEARHHTIPLLGSRFTDPHFNLLISVDQALGTLDLAPRIRRKCMKSLYKMCANHTSLPTSLHLEPPEDPMGAAVCRGGFADVYKCQQSCGQEVAVKVLRPCNDDRSQRMVDVGRCTAISLHMSANRASHV